MKTIKFFGFQIQYSFSFEKVKRIEINIPNWADDTHVNSGTEWETKTSDGKPKVVYYKGSKKFELPLPIYKRYNTVSVSPLYNKERTALNTNRKIIVDCFS